MKIDKYFLVFTLSIAGFQSGFAQTAPPPAPITSPTPKISTLLTQNLEKNQENETPREKREQALAKLFEGHRYTWGATRMRSPTGVANSSRLAKQAFQKAVELDPKLAEGYTALAEIAITAQPTDIEEAILLASIATKIEPNNFGGHRILARLYTFKSRLNNGILDPNFTQKAISGWKEVTRLDPRNAEAWAFLSEFYDKTNKPTEKIDALRKWIASASPIETQFYRRVMGGEGSLAPESASLKLGTALLKTGNAKEALEIFSQVVADDAENVEAVELLKESLETADEKTSLLAVESLQQAVFSNPTNTTLIVLLAQVQARGGKIDDAAKTLRDSSTKILEADKVTAANLQVSLGDLFLESKRVDEAITAYNNALTFRGIEETEPATDDERDFAISVFDKLIKTYKNANRPNDAKATIEKARKILGNDDLFADRQLISFYRETGKKNEALQTVRGLRKKYPDDYGFLRLEATLLTENGKVDEAVSIVKSLIEKKKVASTASPVNQTGSTEDSFIISAPTYDDFMNYLFISGLYTQANRHKEAVASASQALSLTNDSERKQIAQLTIATAQQMSGDVNAAESTLRQILKQSPGNPIALNNLGYFLLERNVKIPEAFELIQKAVKVDPTNPSFLDSLGWAYFLQGNFAEAEKQLLKALSFDESSSTINEHLGDVYSKQLRNDLAKAAWQKALNLASDTKDIERLQNKLK